MKMQPTDTTTTTTIATTASAGDSGRRSNKSCRRARETTKYALLATALTLMTFHEGYLLLNATIGVGDAVPGSTRAMSDVSFESPTPYDDWDTTDNNVKAITLLGSFKNGSKSDIHVDEKEQQLLPQPDEQPEVQEEEQTQLDQKEQRLLKDIPREIALIHVGKAGGMTLRNATALQCVLMYKNKKNNNTAVTNWCIKKKFEPDNKLAYQTRKYCHVWDCPTKQFENSTSFLVPLRNPVDRVISTYRYSHPENCNEVNNKTSTRPKGCHNERKMSNGKHTSAYKVFGHCFPLPGVEDFAQASLSPWVPLTRPSGEANLTQLEQWKCRKVARDMLQRKSKDGSAMSLIAPHMFYNYDYYASKSLWDYPDKEVFGIRTEYEWDDMVELDRMMGGTGSFTNEGKSVSHGSEQYHPSPISTEAYHKLCCVLEHEIEIYLDIMSRVENLSEEQKLESTDKLRNKCGVDVSWAKWRSTCRKRLEEDDKVLRELDKAQTKATPNTSAKKLDNTKA